MSEMTVPGSTWAIFPGSGAQADIQALQVRIVSEWLPTSGYEWANAPDVEVYLNDDLQNMQFEVWLPVAKKQ
jgi:AraC family transcriptional regulator